jgi:hypothetical protein
MKRKILFILLAFSAVALVSAQKMSRGMGFPSSSPRVQPVPTEAVTVTGNLTIAQGSLAVINGDTTYLVSGIQRFVGFIDGLKDGARVTLVGSAAAASQDGKTKFLWVNKLTINNKDYDLARPASTAPAQQLWFGSGRRW